MGVPDVCKVPAPPAPPIPLPFPNTGQCPMAVPPTTKVLVSNMPAITTASQIPLSNGDEPGVAGGVVSGMNMGPVAFKLGSVKVKLEGKPAVYLTGMTAHNGSNANMPAGQSIAPSQVKVIVG
jgi:hypothetical protein